MSFPSPGFPIPAPVAAEVLAALFEVSLTGVVLLRPLYAPDDPTHIIDLAFVQLNPAAQRMLGLPECPTESILTRYPGAAETGVFAFYCATFHSGVPGRYDVNYQHEGLDNYYHLAGQRSGELLVLSFTDTADHDRSAVEQALRAAQAHERAARAEADAALREACQQRTLLEQILSQAPAYVAAFSGPHHVYSFFNETFSQVLTQGRAKIGHAFADLFPELVAQGFLAVLDEVYASGQAVYMPEAVVVQHDPLTGQDRTNYVNVVYTPLRNEAGHTLGLLAFAVDATETVQARQQVQQLNQELARTNADLADTVAARTQELAQAQAATEAQRQRQDRLIAEAPALIARLRGPDHYVELANDGFRRAFGDRELVGKPYRQAVPDLTGQPFFERLDAVYRTGETYFGTDELMVMDRTNSGRPEPGYFSYSYQATRDDAGQVDGVLIFAAEVTDQVLARQERETQQLQLEELFMQAPAPIVILTGPNLVFQLVNPAYQNIFPDRELVGKALLDALPELADTPIPELLRRVYDTGEPYTDQELPLRMARHHGAVPEEIHWTFTYQARRDGFGAVDGVRIFAYDVSPQVQARQVADANRQQVRALNQQLAALNDKLYAANAALADANEGLDGANQALTRTNADLDTFIYAASHDLRTPIANVEGLLLALRDELPAATPPNPADPVPPLLAMMLEAVHRFQTTLDHLTDIVRLHDVPAPTESVELAALIADIRLDLAPQLTAADARLTIDLAGCPRLTFAPRHLRSIVYNLLSNAVKYRHPDRPARVHIHCNSTATTAVLAVRDNGLGLSPAQQGQLFGLFRRLHNHVEGAGVGLYTLKKIVENAGGTVTVHSVLGEGSTFTVTLPTPKPTA